MKMALPTRSNQRRSAAGRSGFSLLELLVALTILAIALIPVAYFYSKSLQQIEAQAIRTRALSLAMDRMAEIQQLPASQIRKNTEMSEGQRYALTAEGIIDPATENWTGNDYEDNPDLQVRGMFFYPLPLTFNPYDPDTWYYNNNVGVEHYLPDDGGMNTTGGFPHWGSHINIGNGNNDQYEYEPIGFYRYRVVERDAALDPALNGRIDQSDRRMIGAANAPIAGSLDYFRSGTPADSDKYSIFGRRTIIVKNVPITAAADTDGDNFSPIDDADGGATALDPYPAAKGPDDKFTKPAEYGPGYEVTVQVFWLPRNASDGTDGGTGIVPWRDLNKVELKAFVAEDGTFTWLDEGNGAFSRNDHLIVTAN
jgi:prepilin-type N-terminal cleavage/methylation domain-containing protein